jgi:hypothetical protein
MNSSILDPVLRRGALSWFLFALAGCQSGHGRSPVLDVFGSYFPAWLICIGLGLTLTIVARQIFAALKLSAHLHPAPIIYFCLWIVFTLTVWLVLYRN